jgi:formate/nitrite transporter FocA (FNT family)
LCGHEYDFRHQTFKRIANAFDHVNLLLSFFFSCSCNLFLCLMLWMLRPIFYILAGRKQHYV